MADSKNLVVLNLGSQWVRGAVFGRTSGGELVLKKYESAELMGDPSIDATRIPQFKVAIAELSNSLKLKGSSGWYSIAGHSVFVRFVKLPPVSGDKVDQIVEFEARQNVPFPINEVSWDYEFTNTEDVGEREVAIVAIRLDALNDLNDQVAGAGIKTKGVDLAPSAIYNAFRYSYPEVDESCVLIDLGARSTNLIFVDGGRMFTRNVLLGGAAVTSAIAKEFGIGFGDAENQKVTQGFISLGGNYDDHADAGIAALSKVIRNSMTKLHGEIMRTITYYRAQQGGSAPKRIFLCGGGAQMGFVAEFFQEKFKVPVEIFDALRGVQKGPGVDVQADAHMLGELVGLALRAKGSTPLELELVPGQLAIDRDAAKRAPTLWMAGLCMWGLLGASTAYVMKADEATKAKLAIVQAQEKDLAENAQELTDLNDELDTLKGQSSQIQQAVNDRTYWVRLLKELNSKSNDLIWFTTIEPIRNGAAVGPKLWTTSSTLATASLWPPPTEYVVPSAGSSVTPPVAPVGVPVEERTELRLVGLYRNDLGQETVYEFARSLAGSEFYKADDIKENLPAYCKAEAGVGDDRHAYTFEIRLPLKQHIQLKQ
jgi:type IV pilus assembly protein PilM